MLDVTDPVRRCSHRRTRSLTSLQLSPAAVGRDGLGSRGLWGEVGADQASSGVSQRPLTPAKFHGPIPGEPLHNFPRGRDNIGLLELAEHAAADRGVALAAAYVPAATDS